MTDKKEDVPKTNVDEELSNLLDSALEDFTKIEATQKDAKTDTSSKEVSTSNQSANIEGQEWSNDFIQQAANQFEENFANFLAGADPNAQVTPEFIQQKLQQMADAAQQVLENPTQAADNSVDFASSITQAIQSLNAGAEGLQAPLNEEELMKMFTGDKTGQENDLLPFMQGMMQGLLSKEVLGPSLEDFVQRLPEYIEKNKDTLDKKDIERYENQKRLMEEVLQELNKETEEDSTEIKTERFSKVLGLMQKLQDYGQPPAELVGDLETPFSFDPQGNPMNFPNPAQANSECNLM
ncbi:peroxisomal biogenesis factor 19 [Diabrotica virgifera virgifera]|uniref:Peroxin-19 n=1 Tax=Diabrotica virgifera virgifera TaxID=50390 RepID=A0ABM5I9M3_DIAVI|nr:peroxisomal biogenesis factor 19 [Diabrotica virgifera virgifera]